jgi:copper(I)-binding protein
MEGDIMRMRRVEDLPLPPGESVELRPGGLHLMLLGLTRSLLDGDTVDLTLHFDGAPDLAISVPVRSSEGG